MTHFSAGDNFGRATLRHILRELMEYDKANGKAQGNPNIKQFYFLADVNPIRVAVQVVKDGGENNLHYHTNTDIVYFVLNGRLRFHGPDMKVTRIRYGGRRARDPMDESVQRMLAEPASRDGCARHAQDALAAQGVLQPTEVVPSPAFRVRNKA